MCSHLTVVILCVGLWVQCCIIESENICRWRPRPCDWHLRAGPLQLSGGFIRVWAECDMFSWSLNRAEKAPQITLCGILWFLQTLHSVFRVRPSSVRRCVTTLRSFAFSIWKSWAWSVLAGCPGVTSLIILNNYSNIYRVCCCYCRCMLIRTVPSWCYAFHRSCVELRGLYFRIGNHMQIFRYSILFNNIHTQTQCIPQKLDVQRMPAGLWPRPFCSFRVLKSHLQSQKISIIQKDSAYQKRSEGQILKWLVSIDHRLQRSRETDP